jgi:hypothetical protein
MLWWASTTNEKNQLHILLRYTISILGTNVWLCKLISCCEDLSLFNADMCSAPRASSFFMCFIQSSSFLVHFLYLPWVFPFSYVITIEIIFTFEKQRKVSPSLIFSWRGDGQRNDCALRWVIVNGINPDAESYFLDQKGQKNSPWFH